MLTVRQVQPAITDVDQLRRNGDYVGYQKNTFEGKLLEQHGFDKSKIIAYESPEEYAEALSKGSRNGGVAAIFRGIPHSKLYLAKHCTGYTMVAPVYKAGGMGFVFPKGSPLVPDISRSILNVTEGDIMFQIEKKWFGDRTACQESPVASNDLEFHSFWGLFVITGAASTCSLLIFLIKFLYKNWQELQHAKPNGSIWEKIGAWLNYYNRKEPSSCIYKGSETFYANVKIEVEHDINEHNDRLSMSTLSDVDSITREEEITSAVLATPCPDDQLSPQESTKRIWTP